MQPAPGPALPAWAQWRDHGLVVLLHVQPGARRTAMAGVHGGRLKIALQAPPVDGKANEALLRYLADFLALRRAELELVAGTTSRDKAVALRVPAERGGEALERLAAAIAA